MFLEEQVDDINRKLGVITKDDNVMIWGAGENAVRLFQYANLSLYNISCIIDKKLYGQSLFGKVIMKPDDVCWDKADAVIITAYVGKDEIKKELLERYGYKGIIITIHDDIPAPFYKLVSKRDISPAEYNEISILQKNSKYKDIHEGERVFILCTGPSIGRIDLSRLKNEKTIAVNSFYLHKDCQLISPDYYCVPTAGRAFTKDVETEFLKELRKAVPETNYFFSISDKSVIDQIEEYKSKNVNYMLFSSIPDYENFEVDLTNLVMSPQSVPIMALEMALYMGFREIYLLGTEHDNLVTGKYGHFYHYSESVLSKASEYEDVQGNAGEPFDLALRCTYKLWSQYKIMKKIAERRGTKIYNATLGGILDVFERVDYNSLF